MNSMQYNNAKFASCALAILLSLSSATYAAQLSGLTRKMERPEDVKFISLNRPTLAPYAYVRFCANNPQDCNADHDNATLDLTSDKRSVLQRINNEVNARIKPKMDAVGADTWEAAPSMGLRRLCADQATRPHQGRLACPHPAHCNSPHLRRRRPCRPHRHHSTGRLGPRQPIKRYKAMESYRPQIPQGPVPKQPGTMVRRLTAQNTHKAKPQFSAETARHQNIPLLLKTQSFSPGSRNQSHGGLSRLWPAATGSAL